jgi:EAL domain-containing protein (putative c-di-GMP-specific phosphodiesterase class I)
MLRRIIANEEVTTLFQPIIHTKNGAVAGYEALSRGPIGFFHLPGTLFGQAARYGCLVEMEILALRKALQYARLLPWPENAGTCGLFLNISPHTLCNLPRNLRSAFEACLFPVVLELTEHRAISNYKSVRNVVNELRAHNVRFAVDDIGSNNRLHDVAELSPNYLKLDRSIIQQVESLAYKPVVKSIVVLAKELGASVIAEGVETKTQFNAVRSLGVAFAQGFFLGKPSSVSVFTRENWG